MSDSCDPMYSSLLGSSVHGILQAKILEWVVIFSPGNCPNPEIEPGSPAMQADSWSYDTEIPFLSIYAREVKTRSPQDICIAIFTAALLTTVKLWKLDNQNIYLKKKWYIYIDMYDSCKPMDYIAHQAPFVQGISQARLLGWVAISFSRGSSWLRVEPGSLAGSLLHCRHILYQLRHQGHLYKYNGILFSYEKEGHSAACNIVGHGRH